MKAERGYGVRRPNGGRRRCCSPPFLRAVAVPRNKPWEPRINEGPPHFQFLPITHLYQLHLGTAAHMVSTRASKSDAGTDLRWISWRCGYLWRVRWLVGHGAHSGSHRCFICLVFAVNAGQEFARTTREKNGPLERLLGRLRKRLGIRASWGLPIFMWFFGGRGHGGEGATDGGRQSREGGAPEPRWVP